MAISLKRYEPQVKVSAETGTQQISGAVASQMISAAGSEFETLAKAADIGSDIFNKLQEKKDEAEVARLNNEMETDSLAFKQQISEMNDDVEVNKFYSNWREKQVEKFNQNNLSRRVLKKAEISFNSYLDKVGISVQERAFNIIKEKADRSYFDLEDAAIRGVLKTDPSTGEMFTSREDQYNYAQDKLVDNGTLKYDTALKNKRNFLENADDGIFKTLLQSDRVEEAEALLLDPKARFSTQSFQENTILLQAAKTKLALKQSKEAQVNFQMGTQQFRESISLGNIPTQIIPLLKEQGIDVERIEEMTASLNLAESIIDNPKQVRKAERALDYFRDENNTADFALTFNKIFKLKGITLSTKSELIQELFDASDEMGVKTLGYSMGYPSSVKESGWKSDVQKSSYVTLNDNYERALGRSTNKESYNLILEQYIKDRKELNSYWKENPNATLEEWNKVSNSYLGKSASYSVKRVALPVVTTQAQYDALPVGAEYREENGQIYRKQ